MDSGLNSDYEIEAKNRIRRTEDVEFTEKFVRVIMCETLSLERRRVNQSYFYKWRNCKWRNT